MMTTTINTVIGITRHFDWTKCDGNFVSYRAVVVNIDI